jgi:hypothetical protein
MRHPVQFLKTILLCILLTATFLGCNCLKKNKEQHNYFLLPISVVSLVLISRTYFNSFVTLWSVKNPPDKNKLTHLTEQSLSSESTISSSSQKFSAFY